MADDLIGPYGIPKIASDDPVQRVRYSDALAVAINNGLGSVRGEAVAAAAVDAAAKADAALAAAKVDAASKDAETLSAAKVDAQSKADVALGAAKEDAAAKYRPISRGGLTDGTDLNTLVGPQHVGAYSMAGSASYVNAPPISSSGVLEVERGPGNALSVLQRVTAGTQMFWREAVDTTVGSWSAWVQAETTTGAQSKADTALSSAKTYTDSSSGSSLGSAKTYADQVAATALGSAKTYTDGQIATRETPAGAQSKATAALTSAKEYTDTENTKDRTRLGNIETKNTDQDVRLDGRVLTAGADFHAVTENGDHKMLSFPTNWAAQNMPSNIRGVLTVQTFAASRILTYRTFEAAPRVLMKSFVGGVWSAWRDLEAVAVSLRDGVALTTNTDLLTLGRGQYQVVFFTKAGDNAPAINVRGALNVRFLTSDGAAKILEFVTYETAPRLFVGSTLGGAWNGWTQIGAQEAPEADSHPGSGLKVVPLNVTIGGSSGTDAPLTGHARYPMKWHAPILRVRVCIQNVAPITGAVRTGAVDVNGIWLGKHAGAGKFTATPRQVVGPFSTPADGSAYKSKWVWLDQTPGVEDLLSLGYTASNGTVGVTIANSWRSADPATAGDTAPTVTSSATAPFFVWLEAETYSTTPHVAAFGDSLSSGVSAGGPMHSWLAQYCERVKALPTHYSNSGDTMQSWASDLESFKWHVFDGLAKPDALIWAMGSNDLFADSISLATAQGYFATLHPVLQERVSKSIYLANIMPRTSATGANEDKRRAYNTWLTGLPFGARDLFNFRDAISSDDETIRPEYDADGVHLNPAGYGAMAAAITRPVTNPPVMFAS